MGAKVKKDTSEKADKLVLNLVDEIISLCPKGSLTSGQKLAILHKVKKAQEIGYDEAYQFYLGDSESAEPFDEDYEEDDDDITWGYGVAD